MEDTILQIYRRGKAICWDVWKGVGWFLVDKALFCIIILYRESISCHNLLVGKSLISFSGQ